MNFSIFRGVNSLIVLFLFWSCHFNGAGSNSANLSSNDSELKMSSVQSAKQNSTTNSTSSNDRQFFGYYKIKGINDLKEMQDHATVVHIQTGANTGAITLEDLAAFEQQRTMNSSYKVIVEWGGLTMYLRGANCTYNKCFLYDHERFTSILNAVIDYIVKPYGSKIIAFYIADEPETNPPTIAALNRAIEEIKKRPETKNIPLWINFDNVLSQYSGTTFVLPNGLDWASLTPSFGAACTPSNCDSARYQVLLDAMAARNAQAFNKMSLVVVGDAWSRSSDIASGGGLSATGVNHLGKIDYLYDYVLAKAAGRGIVVKGMITFAWSECCGGYSLENSHASIKAKWKTKAQSITGLSGSAPQATATPAPNPTATTAPTTSGGTNNAQYLEQSIPTTMTVGTNYQVSVKFKNTGSSTWSNASMYRLGSQNPQDNTTWGTGRVLLNANVAPGGTHTFTFTIRAPSTPGNYNFRWRMLRESVEWFGGYSTNLAIQVKNAGSTSGSTTTPPSTSTSTYYFSSIHSTSILANWDISKAIDNNPNTIYSSQWYPSAYPSANSLHIEAYLPQYATVRYLEISARMSNGRPLGFPQSYRIHVTNANNTNWVFTNNQSLVPAVNSSGVVRIDLGANYYTVGVHIIFDQLGVDDNNNHYLQIADMKLLK